MTKALPIKFNVPGSTIDVPEEGHVDMVRVERTLAWLKEHYKFWDQSYFMDPGDSLMNVVHRTTETTVPMVFDLQESDDGENECGTTFCFAGAALILHDRLAIRNTNPNWPQLWPLAADGEFAHDHPVAAKELLGLTDDQEELIFYLVPVERQDYDVDVFIQYVRDVVTGKANNKAHYYEMLYAKHSELDPRNENYVGDADAEQLARGGAGRLETAVWPSQSHATGRTDLIGAPVQGPAW